MTTTPTPAVEKVAQAIWEAESVRATRRSRLTPWDDESEETKNRYRPLARAAIAAMPAIPDQGWQPIAEAPRDGREVLVYVPRRLGAIYAAASNATDVQWWSRNLGDVKPTHFRPLPTPPLESDDG